MHAPNWPHPLGGLTYLENIGGFILRAKQQHARSLLLLGLAQQPYRLMLPGT